MPVYDSLDKRSFIFSPETEEAAMKMREPHYHGLCELYFMDDGACNYFIDDKIYEVRTGDLVFIPEGVIHKTLYTDAPHSRRLINCPTSFIPLSARASIASKPYLFRGDALSAQIRETFDKIEQEHERDDEYSRDAIKAHVRLMFLLLARNADTASRESAGSRLVEDAVRHIRESFAYDVTLAQSAKAAGVSAEYLSRRFKRETGFGFNEYLTLIRLRHAEKLLSERQELSISQVALSCGFNDSNYFSLKFKQHYGVAPTAYKKGLGI